MPVKELLARYRAHESLLCKQISCYVFVSIGVIYRYWQYHSSHSFTFMLVCWISCIWERNRGEGDLLRVIVLNDALVIELKMVIISVYKFITNRIPEFVIHQYILQSASSVSIIKKCWWTFIRSFFFKMRKFSKCVSKGIYHALLSLN